MSTSINLTNIDLTSQNTDLFRMENYAKCYEPFTQNSATISLISRNMSDIYHPQFDNKNIGKATSGTH